MQKLIQLLRKSNEVTMPDSDKLYFLPDALMEVKYKGANNPGASIPFDLYQDGGNCQIFAFELLT